MTDRATFAHLCDVYVEAEHRGRGLATPLLRAIDAHPDLQGRRWSLGTREAHALYARFGYRPLASAAWHMERRHPNPYGARLDAGAVSPGAGSEAAT